MGFVHQISPDLTMVNYPAFVVQYRAKRPLCQVKLRYTVKIGETKEQPLNVISTMALKHEDSNKKFSG
jgi:hypothetical protein